jgi:MoxR-like ATPase
MIMAAKALAVLHGRDYAVPGDVRALALDVLRHRIVLSYEALADNVSSDEVLERVLAAVPMPEVPPNLGRERRAGAAGLASDNA